MFAAILKSKICKAFLGRYKIQEQGVIAGLTRNLSLKALPSFWGLRVKPAMTRSLMTVRAGNEAIRKKYLTISQFITSLIILM